MAQRHTETANHRRALLSAIETQRIVSKESLLLRVTCRPCDAQSRDYERENVLCVMNIHFWMLGAPFAVKLYHFTPVK